MDHLLAIVLSALGVVLAGVIVAWQSARGREWK